MSSIATLLDEAARPSSDFVRRDAPTYVVPPELTEGTGDDWMGTAIRQMQTVAPAHVAYLKKETGRGWKLFKHFLTDGGRLLFRFDLSRRQDLVNDPMVVLRMAYSASADLYNLQVEVWKSASEKVAATEIDAVDVDMLQDPDRVYYRVEKALAQLKQVREGLEEAVGKKNPRVEKNGDGFSIRFDSNTGVWHWTGDGWAGQGRASSDDPKVYGSEADATKAIPEAKAYILKWKPGWEDYLRESAATDLPMTRKDFIPWDSSLRHRDTGKVMVPTAADLAQSLAYELGAIRWTKGLRTRAAHGAVVIYEKDPSDVVALVGLVGGRVGFESAPGEPDERVNEAVRAALDAAMKRFRPWDSKGESTMTLSSNLSEALSDATSRVVESTEKPIDQAAKAILDAYVKGGRSAATKAFNDEIEKRKLKNFESAILQDKVLALIKAHDQKSEGAKHDGWNVLDEARLNLGADGSVAGGDRTNPTKSGPAAERANTLKSARVGIERMLQAIETVRGWVKSMNLGDKDKTGAAAAALKIAAAEIAKVEDVQRILATMFELPELAPGAGASLDEAILFVEKRAEMTPEASKAKEGLARMVDGLRQLLGMLRQAKLTGRVLDQVDAAINGLKATRDAIDSLFEGIVNVAYPSDTDRAARAKLYPPSELYDKFARMKAGEVRKGFWVRGGTMAEPIYREVMKVTRSDDDMAYVVLSFGAPYLGADGVERDTARFHKDAVITAAKG